MSCTAFLPSRLAARPAGVRSRSMTAKRLGAHGGQHSVDVSALLFGRVQDHAGQRQWWDNGVVAAGETAMKDVEGELRGFGVSGVDGLNVREAVQEFFYRLWLTPVSGPVGH